MNGLVTQPQRRSSPTMGVRHAPSSAPSSWLSPKGKGCDVKCTRGRCSSVVVFNGIRHRRKSQEKFYIILQHFSPFDSFCHLQAGPFPTLPSYYVPCFARNQSINFLAMLIFPGIRGKLSTVNQLASSISASSMVISPLV